MGGTGTVIGPGVRPHPALGWPLNRQRDERRLGMPPILSPEAQAEYARLEALRDRVQAVTIAQFGPAGSAPRYQKCERIMWRIRVRLEALTEPLREADRRLVHEQTSYVKRDGSVERRADPYVSEADRRAGVMAPPVAFRVVARAPRGRRMPARRMMPARSVRRPREHRSRTRATRGPPSGDPEPPPPAPAWPAVEGFDRAGDVAGGLLRALAGRWAA